tara:strand:+ start:1013 stop:1183 length:171 start_codon:yes stop_codon:yes gene_type:complete
VDSKNIREIIGEISELPGWENQTEPNSPNKIGVKKYLINLLVMNFANVKQISRSTK